MSFTHFVWIKNLRGGYFPQLWTEDLTVTKPGSGTSYRGDCVRPIAELVAFKRKLSPEDGGVSLDEAIKRWPVPVS